MLEVLISDAVPQRFPGLHIAFLCAKTPSGYGEGEKEQAERRLLAATKAYHQSVDLLADGRLAENYREFYRIMGLRVSRVTTPIQQSLRALEAGYRSVFPVIDVCMEIEYTTLVSFQLFDHKKLKLPLIYDIAKGDERLATLSGEDKICKPDELMLRDAIGVINSSYYGNARRTAVDASSSDVVIRILGIPGAGRRFDQAVQRTSAVLRLSGSPSIMRI